MMNRESYRSIDIWVKQLRSELPLNKVIDLLSTRLQTANDADAYALASFLNLLLMEAERYHEGLDLIDQIIERYPDDVRFAISKASYNLYFFRDLEEALRCIDGALQRARRTRFFLREALGVKARILLDLARGEQLSRVLDEIMSLEMVDGIPDIGRERDFVNRAPPGLIEDDVVNRYNEFAPMRKK